MAEFEYKFSVIIPVYKVEKYLRETVDSVLSQTIGFKDSIQIIFVNDGTPDGSGEICKQYKDMYPENIIYIEKENGGVSSARNAGIPYIKGKYVNFLDSDDKWDENAFLNAYNFFEEHYDETDALSCRVKKFDSTEDWHILDFKFQKGNRVVDLSGEKMCTFIQSHVSTAIIKAEAITEEDRFKEGVKFGEDSIYINKILLRRLTCGIMADALYYYRKRSDNSSATQLQFSTPDYYTSSPLAYYSSISEYSEKLYGEVVPYIQNVLAYDIGWRVREAPSDIIIGDPDSYKAYCSMLSEKLKLVSEKYIIANRVHRRISYKIAMLKLRDGTELLPNTHYDSEKEAVFYKDISLLRLQSNHKICHINICRIKKNAETGKTVLFIEGLIAKWILSCCPESEIKFVIRVGKKKYDVKLKDYTLIKDKNFFGEVNRYNYFRKKIELDDLFSGRDRIKVEFCLSVSDKPYAITVNYGEFTPSADDFACAHRFFGEYVVTCRNTHITVRKSENAAEDKVKLGEKAYHRYEKLGLFEIAEIRRRYDEIKTEISGKKLWLISDKIDNAKDNGEAFFRFISKMKDELTQVFPMFVVSAESEDYERLKTYGKVLDPNSESYKAYFLCADKIITSSCADFAVSPLDEREKIYLGDLISSEIIFLQSELIAKNREETLGKFMKNITLFCVARDKQHKSLLKNDYYYYKNEVALTGSARFDLYDNEPEKLIVFMPAKMKDETAESFEKSKCFRFWNFIMNDRKFLFNMMRYGYKGVLCLPAEYREFAAGFNENMLFKVCTDEAYDNVLKKAALLVTDYLPGYEFAYNEKPVIYAQYEELKKYYKLHPECKGMFNFEKAGFGQICSGREETLEAICEALKAKCCLKTEYRERADMFFSFKDKNNCRRVYEAILESENA